MTAKKIPARNEIKKNDQWDLTSLFSTDNDWENLYLKLEEELNRFKNFKGTLGDSVLTFKNAIDFDLDYCRQIEKIYTYAHLRSDEDKTNQTYSAMLQKAGTLYSRYCEKSSFITPEIMAIADEKISSFKKEESLKDYEIYLDRILRYKEHTYNQEIEEILALTGDLGEAPSSIFSQMDNADLKFGFIKNENEESIELSHGNFITLLHSPKREIRKNAFKQYYAQYENHKYSLAATLAASNKKNQVYSKIRKYDSSLDASLYHDNVNRNVYENLLTTVKSNMAPLFNYLNFRKEALKINELHFYDTYVPIIEDIDFHMTYEEAVETCCQALAPLGEDYVKILREGLQNGWVDKYENRGKRSGAYSSGCYDSQPYILLNYDENNINSVYTLIHEAGHSMHSYFSKTNQDYKYADYTIFVAEVASTFNETLLSNYFLRKYQDNPKMQAYILNREIDDIRATLYRQTMFAEFEKLTHAQVEAYQPLTLETFTSIYHSLLETYFGETIVIDSELDLECFRIPHFYSAFYVYKYATGISAAISLAQKVIEGDKEAIANYRNFLTLGGSLYPLEELKMAGVDMNSPQPIEEAINYFSSLVNEFKEVYAQL